MKYEQHTGNGYIYIMINTSDANFSKMNLYRNLHIVIYVYIGYAYQYISIGLEIM